jgi:hypothetical protein
MAMPKTVSEVLNLSKEWMDAEQKAIVDLIVKNDGSIRATKPKVDETNPVTGKAAYVWRMVVFIVSPKGVHQCWPVTADFDLPAYDESGKWSSALSREMAKELKPIEDAIIGSIPTNQWAGAMRWGRAFGRIA